MSVANQSVRKVRSNKTSRGIALAVAGTSVVLASAAYAAPYAAGVSIVGTTVNFTLNENADALVYTINGGPEQSLTPTKGAQSFTLGSPSDTFNIIARKTDAVGYTILTGGTVAGISTGLNGTAKAGGFNLISDETLAITRFNSPRGVTVNNNPNAGALFGTAYVANSAAGTVAARAASATNVASPARTLTGDGIYAIGPAQTDILGQGNAARDGGITQFASSASASSPFRVTVGPDNKVYVADFSDAVGTVWRLESDLTGGINVLNGTGGPSSLPSPAVAASGTNAFTPAGQNHGSTTAVYVEGSSADGTLKVYTLDEDLTTKYLTGAGSTTDQNSVWRYDINGFSLSSSTPYTAAPTKVNGPNPLIPLATSDFTRGKLDGKFYLAQNRQAGSETGLFVLSADGSTVLFNSQQGTRAALNNPTANDLLTNIQGMAVSEDQKWLAVVLNNSDLAVIPLVGGIPDISNLRILDTGVNVNSGRDIAFDIAGNIHYVSSGQGLYRVVSPGGPTQTTVSYNGTAFSFTSPGSLSNQWIDVSGNYSQITNWVSEVPNGVGSNALLGTLITANRNVTLDIPVTLGILTLAVNGAQSYTIDGSNTLTFDNGAAVALVTVLSGASHTITAPVLLNSTTSITLPSGSTLNLATISATDNTKGLSIFGGGTVVVTGDNASFQSPITVGAGTLQIGNGGSTGSLGTLLTAGAAITNNGTIRFNTTTDISTPAVITGTGALIKSGTNTLTLTGNSTFTGRTTISGGVLNLGDGGATGSLASATMTNSGTLRFNHTNDSTLPAAISGTGSVEKLNTNTVVFTGASTYTGPTLISAGALRVGNSGTTGSLGNTPITNNSLLIFQRSGSVTFAGSIAGTGNFLQAGDGSVTLTGNLTYTGNTSVTGNGGVLIVNKPLVTPAASLTVSGASARATFAAAADPSVNIVAAKFQTITVSNNSVVSLTNTVRPTNKARVLIANTLDLAFQPDAQPATFSGSLDLANNDAILTGMSLASVSDMVKSWVASGELTGKGIISSAAVANPLTTLAVALPLPSDTTFDGVAISSTDVLVKYTYLGDTDLSGAVDLTDLNNLIAGIRTGATGWRNGDTNYDGVIDATDYANALTAFRFQGSALDNNVAAGGGAVPEPSALSFLGLAVAPLLRRRRA